MKYCCDCAYMDTNEGEGKNIGKYPCTNKRVKDNYVSARKVVRGGDSPFFFFFLEAFWSRGEWEREQYMKESKRHGYYVVSAVCEILGLEDKTSYLNRFIYFRDIILPELCPSIISQYEFYGPIFAEKIRGEENKEEIASCIFDYYIFDMVNCIKNEKYQDALNIFKAMIKELKTRYIETPKVYMIGDNK